MQTLSLLEERLMTISRDDSPAGLAQAGLVPGAPVDLATGAVRVRRLLGLNPGPMTGPGTNSYLLGTQSLTLIDPGPIDAAQQQNFLDAIGDATLTNIVVTHTHGDHSPAAKGLAALTGARLIGLNAPDAAGQDHSFVSDRVCTDGDVIACQDGASHYSLQLVHTPGHVSNHLCVLLREEGMLFTGDHVLQGTTPVILPPDGNMSDYLNSLTRLLELPLVSLAPAHGEMMLAPFTEIEKLIAHRLKREAKILGALRELGECSDDDLVQKAYDDVGSHLLVWAKKTMSAHLIKLEQDGLALFDAPLWKAVR